MRELTTSVAAAHCRVSVPTLKRWIHSGALTAYRTPGGHYRIDTYQFHRFLESQGIPPYRAAPPAETRLLVVDDDPAIVSVLTTFLSNPPWRFNVETASDGYNALVKVGAFKPAILVLDVFMPHLDGIEVCRRLRVSPEVRGIKILGITGRLDAIPALLEAGAHECLAKPFRLEEVRRAVERLLPLPSDTALDPGRFTPGGVWPGPRATGGDSAGTDGNDR